MFSFFFILLFMEKLRQKAKSVQVFFGMMPLFKQNDISKVQDLAITCRTQSLLRNINQNQFGPCENYSLCQLFVMVSKYLKSLGLQIPNGFINISRLERKCEMEIIRFSELMLVLVIESSHRTQFEKALASVDEVNKHNLMDLFSLFHPNSTNHDQHHFLLSKINQLEEQLGELQTLRERQQIQMKDLQVSKRMLYEQNCELKTQIYNLGEQRKEQAYELDRLNQILDMNERKTDDLVNQKLILQLELLKKNKQNQDLTYQIHLKNKLIDAKSEDIDKLQDMLRKTQDEVKQLSRRTFKRKSFKEVQKQANDQTRGPNILQVSQSQHLLQNCKSLICKKQGISQQTKRVILQLASEVKHLRKVLRKHQETEIKNRTNR